ncbi:uncharacterized protein M421DRAFT_92059 [Didymella exigua CBS 183.55]|uniref:RING-type domain-containing protein n=1 Tax=Didymella exigua CBS 183.55 TaxID=1150837 RepID=A0A6A5RMS5_9PLEO|nr:uncharacterized protein M421DRAFT_92059 [Didymella exigua CBS 183.55]KAF1928939.1 hypothetical protein M421DRAFT_92059 [Didymella exigua CBS 183.55]
MTVSKSGGASKKLGPISTGSKIVRFDVPNLTRRFTVHEDVICRTSKVFKARFQQRRKELTADCSICFDDLNAVVQEISFCDTCGQNFHEDCTKKWTADRIRTYQQATCPMCCGAWANKSLSDLERLRIDQELDGQAVQSYLDWLYSRTVRIDVSISRTGDAFNLALLRCWKVSSAVQDTTFRDAIIATFFTEAKTHFWNESIEFAFGDKEKLAADMRNFVVEVFMTRMESGWFEGQSDEWPKAFVKALADKSLERALANKKDFEDLKAMYMGTDTEDREASIVAEEKKSNHAAEEPDDSIYGKSTPFKRQIYKRKRPPSHLDAELEALRAAREADEDDSRKKKGSADVVDRTANNDSRINNVPPPNSILANPLVLRRTSNAFYPTPQWRRWGRCVRKHRAAISMLPANMLAFLTGGRPVTVPFRPL